MGYVTDRCLVPLVAVYLGLGLFCGGVFLVYGLPPFLKMIGFGMVVVGSGFYKPALTQQIGEFSGNTKTQGFTFMYMALNLGSFCAAVMSGILGESLTYEIIFPILGIILLASLLLTGWLLRHRLKSFSLKNIKFIPAAFFALLSFGCVLSLLYFSFIIPYLTITFLILIPISVMAVFYKEKSSIHIKAMPIVGGLVAFMAFAALYDQYGSVLIVFIDTFVNRKLFGFINVPTVAFQGFNPLLILGIGAIITLCFQKRKIMGSQASSGLKYAFSFGLLGLSFCLLIMGTELSNGKVGIYWFIIASLFQVIGELIMVPTLLSTLASTGSEELKTTLMGLWFLSISGGHFMVTLLTSFINEVDKNTLQGFEVHFVYLVALSMIFGLASMTFSRTSPFRRLAH